MTIAVCLCMCCWHTLQLTNPKRLGSHEQSRAKGRAPRACIHMPLWAIHASDTTKRGSPISLDDHWQGMAADVLVSIFQLACCEGGTGCCGDAILGTQLLPSILCSEGLNARCTGTGLEGIRSGAKGCTRLG